MQTGLCSMTSVLVPWSSHIPDFKPHRKFTETSDTFWETIHIKICNANQGNVLQNII